MLSIYYWRQNIGGDHTDQRGSSRRSEINARKDRKKDGNCTAGERERGLLHSFFSPFSFFHGILPTRLFLGGGAMGQNDIFMQRRVG